MKLAKFVFSFYIHTILISAASYNHAKKYLFKLKDNTLITSIALNDKNCECLVSLNRFTTEYLLDSNVGPIPLDFLKDLSMFKLYLRFISENSVEDINGIDFNTFESFYNTSHFLKLKDDSLVEFSKNMVRFGLFGCYCLDILKGLPSIF